MREPQATPESEIVGRVLFLQRLRVGVTISALVCTVALVLLYALLRLGVPRGSPTLAALGLLGVFALGLALLLGFNLYSVRKEIQLLMKAHDIHEPQLDHHKHG